MTEHDLRNIVPEDVKVFIGDKEIKGVPLSELTLAPKGEIDFEAIDSYPVQTIPVKFKKLDRLATTPRYAHKGDAGFDLFSVSAKTIHPGETVVIKTGIAMQIPRGYEVQIRPRSGLSLNTKIRIANSPGTIDSIYRGEVGVIIENTGNKNLHVDIGDKIAQGVLKKQPVAQFIEVDELGKSDRGESGYGSTGLKG